MFDPLNSRNLHKSHKKLEARKIFDYIHKGAEKFKFEHELKSVFK